MDRAQNSICRVMSADNRDREEKDVQWSLALVATTIRLQNGTKYRNMNEQSVSYMC